MRHGTLVCAAIGLALIVFVGADGPVEPKDKIWHFDGDAVGKLPVDWTSAQTGTGEGSVWQVVADETAPSGGRGLAQVSATGPTRLFNLAVADGPQWADLDLAVSVKAVAGQIDQGGGPVWRYRDAANYYIARINPLENNFRVYKVVAGKRTELDNADLDIPAEEWHTIRVVQVGPSIRCYLNGRLRLSAEDTTFAEAGRVGLWTKADAVTAFDDLSVRPAEIVEALVLTELHEEGSRLHNLIRVTDQVFSGSEPEDEAAFEELARLGVKTVVSVDGAEPRADLACRFGMRYIHIPIGYDGIPDEARRALFRLVDEGEAPFYFHCHHGKHRGPTAAAGFCIAQGLVTGAERLKLLERVGTGKQYQGLWDDVKEFRPLQPGEELPELRERAEVDSLAAAMAKLDRNNDHLKLCQEATWNVPPDRPDIVPEQEARQLAEALAQSVEFVGDDYPEEVRTWMAEARTVAEGLRAALADADAAAADRHFKTLTASCKQCHTRHRDVPE